MKKHHFICTIAVLLAMVANVQAQEERNKSLINSYLHGWEYNIKAGFNIGGTSPIPLPKEIRKIDSYAPGIAIAIEGNATKWFDEKKKWGLTLGLRLENKNMTTEATVKNYGMKIINTNGGELAGLWTGGVKTKVKNSYLTIPILADYRISKRWIVSAGPYFSYLLDRSPSPSRLRKSLPHRQRRHLSPQDLQSRKNSQHSRKRPLPPRCPSSSPRAAPAAPVC